MIFHTTVSMFHTVSHRYVTGLLPVRSRPPTGTLQASSQYVTGLLPVRCRPPTGTLQASYRYVAGLSFLPLYPGLIAVQLVSSSPSVPHSALVAISVLLFVATQNIFVIDTKKFILLYVSYDNLLSRPAVLMQFSGILSSCH